LKRADRLQQQGRENLRCQCGAGRFDAAQIGLFDLNDPLHRIRQIVSQAQAEPVGRGRIAQVEVVGSYRSEGKRLAGHLLDGELPGGVFQLIELGRKRLTVRTVADHHWVRQRHTVPHKQQGEQPEQLSPGWVLMGAMFSKWHKTSFTIVRSNGWPKCSQCVIGFPTFGCSIIQNDARMMRMGWRSSST
jgi:hypothetical protein